MPLLADHDVGACMCLAVRIQRISYKLRGASIAIEGGRASDWNHRKTELDWSPHDPQQLGEDREFVLRKLKMLVLTLPEPSTLPGRYPTKRIRRTAWS